MKAKLLLMLLLFIFGRLNANAQIKFQKTFGGGGLDEAHCVKQTADSGYIIAGYTTSVGAGNHDVYLIKISETGDTLWTKTYGSMDYDYGFSVQQTTEGGYIIAGNSNHITGYYSAYLIKTDNGGDTLWTKSFGGYTPGSAASYSIQQTFDGGYILTGDITIDGDVGLTKTDSNGTWIWTKSYGGSSSYDIGYSVQQTTDSGYVITGYTNSFGAGYYDFYFIKTDENGDTLWTKTFGGTGADIAWSVRQTSDGGYIIAGGVSTTGVTGSDACLIKTNYTGDTLWTKTYGDVGGEMGYCVRQTSDGGYIVAGEIRIGSSVPDVYLMKTDSVGNWAWSRNFGGPNYDGGWSVEQTKDGGYIIAGYTNSFGAGSNDFYLIKTDANGISGCNEGNPINIADTFSIIVGVPPTLVSSGVTITPVSTLIGSGGVITDGTLCTTVDIIEMTADHLLSINPNPFAGELLINGTIQSGTIVIIDLSGKEIIRYNSQNIETKINTENILPGFYLLNYSDRKKNVNTKMVKF